MSCVVRKFEYPKTDILSSLERCLKIWTSKILPRHVDVSTCCSLSSTKLDVMRDKLATKLAIPSTHNLAAVYPTEQSVQLCVQHNVAEAARRAVPSATTDTCITLSYIKCRLPNGCITKLFPSSRF